MTEGPSIGVSVQMKVNLGNYESADAFLSIAGVTEETTPEQMDALMEQGRIAYGKLAEQLGQRVRTIREAKHR